MLSFSADKGLKREEKINDYLSVVPDEDVDPFNEEYYDDLKAGKLLSYLKINFNDFFNSRINIFPILGDKNSISQAGQCLATTKYVRGN